MNSLFMAGLLLASYQDTPPTLEVATGDWSNIPVLETRSFADIISTDAVDRVHKLLGEEGCVIPGQSKRRVDLRVPFLVHYAPSGKINKVVLHRLGCTKVESMLGSTLLKLAEKNRYKSTGVNQAGWYRSEFTLTSS